MMKLVIAGHSFAINPRNAATTAMLRDYLCDSPADPELTIELTDSDLEGFDSVYDPSIREFYAIHEKIAQWLLANHDTLLFHGSCLALDGQGVLFTAPSGTGKSTHARLWRRVFGSRVRMINDDKPLLAMESDGSVRAYGSPWCGKEGIGSNSSAPLRAIVFLHQAPENSICRLCRRDAAKRLISQALMMPDMALRLKALALVEKLSAIPVFEMGCTPTPDAAVLCHSTLLNLLQ